ncbi:uncharacterized protein LOC129793111 [Lutzomyia longipalpis]|uniref:uncharacterized protein LOC129793111 n=1 Tax=Lutzomyia longipalpis TaxID=7200 RepID=UPI002484414A|nr:uncharacterized protein LOC129793111 [Lutzomyia longipalpis]XP_055688738.1 uncharacterized protein LOC129793111 [Lutzomyia longipalpis]
MGNCERCKKVVARGDPGSLQCVDCKHLFHGVCLKITEEQLRDGNSAMWCCENCSAKKKTVSRKVSVSDGQFTDLVSDMRDLKTEMTSNSKKMDNFLEKLDFIISELGSLRSANSKLDSRIETLEVKMRDITLTEDSKEIEIMGSFGIEERDKYKKAIDIIRQSLGISADMQDIDECFILRHRGKPDSSTVSQAVTDRHSLIVRLTTCRMRDEIMREWRKRRAKDGVKYSSVSDGERMLMIRERLPKASKALMDAARNHAKKFNWRYVWVKRGRIFLRKADGERAIWVRSCTDLEGLQ